MKIKRSITIISALTVMLSNSGAQAQSRDAAVGIGVGLGLGLLLNEMSNGGPRSPNDKLIGRVPEGGRRAKPPTQNSAEREQRQRQIQEQRQFEMQENADVQTRLKALDFYAGETDGKTGPQTKTAISAFQQSLGQRATGVLSPDQKNMLISSTTTAPAMTPPASALQPLTASTPSLAPLNSGAPVSPQDPFANATSMLPQPGNLGSPQPTATPEPGAASILGVSPAMGADDAFTRLASAKDTEWCSRTVSAIVCNSNETTYSDEVVVGITAPDKGARVHSVIRTTKFTPAVARAAVEGKVRENYPTLVAAQGGALASSDDCAQTIQTFRPDGFNPLKQWIISGASLTPSLSALAVACNSYGEVALPLSDTIPGFTIALFSGQPLQAGLVAGTLAPAATPAPDIRF